MAKFMRVPQTFLFRKYLGFWGNLLRNYDGGCQDGAFFAPVLDSFDRLGNLAPGDFRTVRQELFYLGRERTNRDRIAALQAECALKKDGRRPARIGFTAHWKNG